MRKVSSRHCYSSRYSTVSDDSVNGHQRPCSGCRMCRLIWGFAVRICWKTRFRMALLKYKFYKQAFFSFKSSFGIQCLYVVLYENNWNVLSPLWNAVYSKGKDFVLFSSKLFPFRVDFFSGEARWVLIQTEYSKTLCTFRICLMCRLICAFAVRMCSITRSRSEANLYMYSVFVLYLNFVTFIIRTICVVCIVSTFCACWVSCYITVIVQDKGIFWIICVISALKRILWHSWNRPNKAITMIWQNLDFNPSLAEHDMPCLSKQCRSRSFGFWICTVCH